MEGIGSRVDALGNQSFYAKGHVMLILGRKSLAIQDKLYDAGTDGGGKETILSDIKAAKK